MAQIDAFFKLMHEQGASDLHLASGQQPAIRLHGDIERIKYEVLTSDKLRKLLYEITSQEKIKIFEETGDVDFGYEIPGLARYRANYFMQKNGISAVFREIPSEILTVEQLGLPPVIAKLADLPRGLVLVTGPTGSGKSTTLAAIIDQANRTRKDHIITVEDPIEYNFNFIYQTEVNTSAGYRFSTALKYLMRQDPDVILVGEIRDEETADMCVMASNTGHLVLSTIHANEAITTIQRLLTLTTEKETTLSTIKVIAAQRLLRKLCPYCRKDAPELAEQLLKKYPYLKEHITFEPHTYVHVGCERCRKTGYVGRTTVAEVLKFDDEIIDAFLQDKTIVELHDLLRQKGFLNMNDVGVLKVLMGETDYDEVKRVVQAG